MLLKIFTCLALVLNVKLALSLASTPARDVSKRATYFLQIDPAGDTVVALSINDLDGTVSSPVRTPTGGKGLAGLLSPTQDSLVVSGEFLFAVNPGDNTLSFFVINPEDPTHPTLIGSPAATLGETPLSVAYSPKLNTVCVVNTGAIAGVTCYSVSPTKGLKRLGPMRPIPQTELADPGPGVPGPLVIAQDIVFNPSSSALFVTVRNNGDKPGLLYAYPINDGQVSRSHTVSSLPTLPFVYSLNFLSSDTRLLVTDPLIGSPGAAILLVDYPSLSATVNQSITLPAQRSACWVAYAPAIHTAFVFDSTRANITVVNTDTGAIQCVINFEGERGAADSLVQRKWLYSLTTDLTDPRLYIFDVEDVQNGKTPVQVQAYHLFKEVSGFGPLTNWMGLASYPSSRD